MKLEWVADENEMFVIETIEKCPQIADLWALEYQSAQKHISVFKIT